MVKALLIVMLALIASLGFSQSFTQMNGRLQLKGKQLCNQRGKPIQLKGFSTFGISYRPECITYDALVSMKEFWGANIIRATVYDDDFSNKLNYNESPAFNKAMVDSMVQWTEKLGMYCIIDWHILRNGNPNSKVHSGAAAFFQEMTTKYAQKTHLLYEICNEPSGTTVTWDTIADYANKIIPIIHKNVPKAVILVGSPMWCQFIDKVQPSKLVDTLNVMYSFHFYATTHEWLIPMFLKEIHRIPVFVSEWGPCESSGDGNINFNATEKYLNAMKQHISNGDTVSISWCNFSYGDKKEAASALKPQSCDLKLWNNMTPTGLFVRDYMMKP
jgi:aryl-phospho-beta-D-glucosidase BglC (GH1 family)